MKPGSKEKNTSGNFSQKQTDSIKKSTIGKLSTGIKNKVYPKKPSSTDSLAVYMRNSDSRSAWKPVADAAEKKYGKIDVSGFDPAKPRKTRAADAFKKYKINK